MTGWVPPSIGARATPTRVLMPEASEARADEPIPRHRCVARRADGTEVPRDECLVHAMRPDDRAPGS